MKTIKMASFIAALTVLTLLLLSCSGEAGGEITTAEPELTLGELPDYSDAHAEDVPCIVFSSDLEPIYIYVCKDKEFIPLSEAYEREWLMPVDILLIAKRNRDFNSYWEENYADPEPGYGYVKYVPELDSTNRVTNYHLGEYTVSFANGAEMWIYSTEQGKVGIDEAYKNGLLTDADVARISERHEAYDNYVLGESK